MATYSASGKDFEKVPEGTHLAVCTLVADVGLQPQKGKFPDPKVKIYLRFEIPSERVVYEKDGVEVDAPQIIYNNYTASMSPKAFLRQDIESWFGKKFANDGEAEMFDVRKVLGHTCMLQVVHSPDGKYANVANIMAPPKGTAKLTPENAPVYYGPDDDKQYEALPKFLKEKVDTQLSVDAIAVAKPPPPMNQPGPKRTHVGVNDLMPKTTISGKTAAYADMTAGEIEIAEREAERQRSQRERDNGSPSLDPNDDIPFSSRGKHSHWD